MSKSSIHFQTAKGNSSSHMSRDSYVSYLIEHDNNHFEYKHYQDPKEYLEFAQVQTKLLTNRKMQSKAIENFIQEAVLNIKKDTTIQEVENLFKTYNKEFKGGFKVFEIALHKDEGVFIDTKHDVDDLVFDSKTLRIYKDGIDVSSEVISLAPNKDIFYNEDTKKWYKEKTFETEIDTSKLQKKMNYHAHISFTKWEELTGKNIRLKKSDLQKIQTITARQMKMERGEKNSQTKRLNHYQIKKLQAEVNSQKLEHHELKLVTVPQLKAKVESKDLTIQELETTKKSHIKAFREILPTVKNEVEVVEYVKTLKNELQATKRLKTSNETLKERLSVSERDMSVLSASLIDSRREVQEKDKTIQSHSNNQKRVEDLLPTVKGVEFSKDTNTVWYMRLAEFVKGLSDKIKNLTKENQELKKENQNLLRENRELELEVKQLSKEEFKHYPLNSENKETPLEDKEAQEYKSNLDLVEAYIKECEEKEKYADSNSDTELK